MAKRLGAFGLPTLVVFLAAAAGGADWPQFRGPNRDGVSSETGLRPNWPKEGPPLLWTYAGAGVGYSGPAVVGERLFISCGRGDAEHLVALDLKAPAGQPPKELWAVKLGPLFTWQGNSWNAGPNATPTVAGGLVFALGGFGDLVCADAATGQEKWRVSLPRDLGGEVNPIGGGLEKPTPLGWGYAPAPLVDGERLICVPGGKQGLFAALDKNTGKVLWRSAEVTDQASYSSPVLAEVGGVRQVIQAVNGGLVGVAAADGKLLWRYRREPAYDDVVIAAPIVHKGLVFATVGFGQGCDLVKLIPDAKRVRAEKVFSNKAIQNRDGGLVRVGDHLYGHSENRGWVCHELATGKALWSERGKLERGSITYADGRLYCCGEEGNIALIDASPKGWSQLGRFSLPQTSALRKPSGGVWTHPVIAGGRLYLRDQEFLYCYDLRP